MTRYAWPFHMVMLFFAAGIACAVIGVLIDEPLLVLLGIAGVVATWWSQVQGPNQSSLMRLVCRFIAVLCVVVVVVCIGAWRWARPPAPDAFYDSPATVASSPGQLIRREAWTRGVPAAARAWRILYTTTDAHNHEAISSALVLAASTLPAGPRPVIAWTHGTTGAVPGCAPSLLPDPFPFSPPSIVALEEVIANGWILVATDYPGLAVAGTHPYLIGEGEARSTLDAVRAARQLPYLSFDSHTLVWGHSQGGHAALWTGGLAPSYAADVPISGVAALAPATALGPLLEQAQSGSVGRIMASYIINAYGETYPDVHVNDYVPWRYRFLAHDMGSRCIVPPKSIVSIVESTRVEGSIFSQPPSAGPLGARVDQNVPRLPIAAPVMIAQGLDDILVLPAGQNQYVADRCAAGQAIEYRTYAGRDHLGLVDRQSALNGDLVQWTQHILAGGSPAAGCQTIQR